MEKRIYYLSNTVIPNTKREKNIHVFNVLTQVGVKQLTDFLRTVTAASDLSTVRWSTVYKYDSFVNIEDSLLFIHENMKENVLNIMELCRMWNMII